MAVGLSAMSISTLTPSNWFSELWTNSVTTWFWICWNPPNVMLDGAVLRRVLVEQRLGALGVVRRAGRPAP